MLLGEEQHRPVFPESSRSDQSADRAVSLGHMQPVGSLSSSVANPILAERNESGRDVSLRMLLIQFVSPNRIELIQLIVQESPRSSVTRTVSLSSTNVILSNEAWSASPKTTRRCHFAARVEIDTEDSAPGAACRQHRVIAGDVIRVASDREEERPKV